MLMKNIKLGLLVTVQGIEGKTFFIKSPYLSGLSREKRFVLENIEDPEETVEAHCNTFELAPIVVGKVIIHGSFVSYDNTPVAEEQTTEIPTSEENLSAPVTQ